jgi:hypothetical protein
MKKLKFLSFIITILIFVMLIPKSYAEELRGPHGGYYRMSGRNHIEIISDLDGNFIVYLLDLKLRNASIENSSVEVKVGADKNKLATLDCISMEDHFYCSNKKIILTNSNTKLYVKAKTLGKTLKEVNYPLPFRSKM